ncbi:MAG: hypothetical protein AAGA46_16720 [Cyanobacteria bacterium P01_F01_bin.13]
MEQLYVVLSTEAVAMKMWHWGWIGLVFLASACGPKQVTAPAAPKAAETISVEQTTSCDPMDSKLPLQPDADGELPFQRFDFRPTKVNATDTTLTFASRRYSFTFCKSDRTWGIEALDPAAETEADYATYLEDISDPDYEPVTDNDQTYRARVRLDASWINDAKDASDNQEQVIFELIKPGAETISQVLYTNTDIIERELGASAGVPHISRALATDDALWWSIGFEQGEGATGIATVIQYKPDTDEVVLWQPTDLDHAQITDMAITGTNQDLTLWLGTQYSGEGNPFLPAKGLVAYKPNTKNVRSYTVENSPLPGAIPTRLWTEDEILWVGTAHGVCEVEWAAIDVSDSWDCWQFVTIADVPSEQELYASLLAESPMDTLESADSIELLWVTDTDISTPSATVRYEISYAPGLVSQLEQGADYYVYPDSQPDEGYFWWPGQDWSWNGQRFVRHRDQVATNYVGGGPQGIGSDNYENYVVDWKTMRGEFELLNLTPEVTEIKYYSAWINGDNIEPWVTVTERDNPSFNTVNPTETVLSDLKQVSQ